MVLPLGMLVLFCAVLGHGLFSWHYGVATLMLFTIAAVIALQAGYAVSLVLGSD